MIPSVKNNILGITVVKQPSLTYALDIERGRIRGKADNLDALKQAIYLCLSTQRYDCLIYSWNYGAELKNLVGQPKEYAMSEIKRCVTEALMQDDRINAVDDFSFVVGKKTIHTTFTVRSVFGDLNNVEWEVAV